MANRYCDHGAYAAYAATPTWGIPQDGDGLAKTASSASSIASITFSSPPTSGSISVCGITITLVSVLSQANITLAADNLASSINAMASPVSSSVVNSTPLLRNLIYARGPTNGAPAGTCQIMMRAGSANLNFSNNANCQIATTFNNVSSTATNHQFAGGVAGCYGYFMNNAGTIWPSAISQYTYGMFGASQPIGGQPVGGDVVTIRAAKTIALPLNATVTMATPAIGSLATGFARYEFDDGTEWPVDGSTPVFKITGSYSSNNPIMLDPVALVFIHIKGKQYASGQRNFVIEVTNTAQNNLPSIIFTHGIAAIYENLDFVCFDGASMRWTAKTASNAVGSIAINCRSRWDKQKSSTSAPFIYHASINSDVRAEFRYCEFSLAAANDIMPGIIYSNGGPGQHKVTFEGCVFKGFINSSLHVPLVAGTAGASSVYLRNCDFSGVTDFGSSYKGVTFTSVAVPFGTYGVFLTNSLDGQEFVSDTPVGFVGWNPFDDYPTLNALLMDGVTPWSIRAVPSANAGNVSFLNPLEIPRLSKINSLPDGVRTLKVNFLLEKNMTWLQKDISMYVTYEDTSGNRKTIYTPINGTGALTTNTALWSGLEADPADSVTRVKYISGGSIYFNRYEMSLTTPTPIATGTEISINVRVHTGAANTTQQVFICPEVVVS